MDDLEAQIRRRYLDSADMSWWDWEDPNLDFGVAALPYFVTAFGRETDPERRHLLIGTIWRFRHPAALRTLALALTDNSAEVWKEALDGFVAIGGQSAVDLLREARGRLGACPDAAVRLEWIGEAIEQVEQKMKQTPETPEEAGHQDQE